MLIASPLYRYFSPSCSFPHCPLQKEVTLRSPLVNVIYASPPRGKYLHKLLGILQQGRFVSFPPFIYVACHPLILVHTHSFTLKSVSCLDKLQVVFACESPPQPILRPTFLIICHLFYISVALLYCTLCV